MFVGVPYARTLNKLPITDRFSDLRPPKEPFPLKISSGTTSFGLATYIATNAYSGATVTDFNRVPFSVTRYYFSKEQTQNTKIKKSWQ